MKLVTGIATLAALALIGGCGSSTTSVETPDGKASVTTDAAGNSKMTAETDKGKMTAETGPSGEVHMETTDEHGKSATVDLNKSVDAAEAGVALYPGATMPDGSRDSKVETGEDVTYTLVRVTSDMPDKVVEFYKKQLKEPAAFTSGDGGTVGGKMADGREVAVMISRDKEKNLTTVRVTVHKKKQK